MRIKGDMTIDLSRPQLQALYMTAKLEAERYKSMPSSDLTEPVQALLHGYEKIWGWLNYSKDPDKEPIKRQEWESMAFAGQVELRRYTGFELRHLRSDLQDLDAAVMEILSVLKSEKVGV